jgi:hypothetical protein
MGLKNGCNPPYELFEPLLTSCVKDKTLNKADKEQQCEEIVTALAVHSLRTLRTAMIPTFQTQRVLKNLT